MKHIYFLIILLLFASSSMASAPEEIAPEVAIELKLRYPNYNFEKVVRTEIPGVYLIYGIKNVMYFMPETGHLIFGDIWSPQGKNLTDGPRKQVAAKLAKAADQKQGKTNSRMKSLIDSLPLDKAVVIGNGPKKVIEITNPDCGFCRKGSDWFESRDDVTRYIFFSPSANAIAKTNFVLGSADQGAAYKQVMSGALDGIQVPSIKNASELLSQHQSIAKKLGVKGTPYYWVIDKGESVSGANFPKLTQLLH